MQPMESGWAGPDASDFVSALAPGGLLSSEQTLNQCVLEVILAHHKTTWQAGRSVVQ